VRGEEIRDTIVNGLITVAVASIILTAIVQSQITERNKFDRGYVQSLSAVGTQLWTK
jgi:hypothetical protein